MLGLKSLAAAAAAAALAVASPALAATMAFHIDVTSATGVSGFAPFSFDETFTLGAGTYSASPGGVSQDFTGAVSGSTPMTASLQGLTDLTGATDSSNYDFGTFSPVPLFGFTQGDIYENILGLNGGYQQSISNFTVGLPPANVDEPGLAAFFAASGAMPWYEQAVGPSFNLLASYMGTATLISPVSAAPEPAAWALMLVGIGAVGAALRLRKPSVLA